MSEQGNSYSDDYVASLLKQDAATSSTKYSALGLQAFLPQRPTSSAPKPNTRFLRNIIRKTDSHNAALLAKERNEAQDRRRKLDHQISRHSSSVSSDAVYRTSRHSKSRSGDVLKRKNSKTEADHPQGDEDEVSSHRRKSRARSRSRSPSRKGHRRHERKRDHHKSNRNPDEHHRRSKHRGESIETQSSRHKSTSNETSTKRHHTHRSNHRSSRSQSKSMSPSSKRRVISRNISPPLSSKNQENTDTHLLDDDPLDDIIGPAPEPRVRSKGRGSLKSSMQSEIDSHFASNYNPSLDVKPNSDTEDDWDQALEALRDRQKWKQQGAERLKSAGFSDAQIKKWERGEEKDEKDVVWAKKGQGREWDRGKVLDDHGMIDLKPAWAATNKP